MAGAHIVKTNGNSSRDFFTRGQFKNSYTSVTKDKKAIHQVRNLYCSVPFPISSLGVHDPDFAAFPSSVHQHICQASVVKAALLQKICGKPSMSITLLEHLEKSRHPAEFWSVRWLCSEGAGLERQEQHQPLPVQCASSSIPATLPWGFQDAEVEALHTTDSVPSKATQRPGLPPGFPPAALF